MPISQACSDSALAAAVRAAAAIGVPMNIAILDEGASLKGFVRMDGALLGSIDIALRKARTSALFAMPTEEVGEYCRPGGPSPGLEATNGGLVVFAGGVPLSGPGGRPIGAIGVSGGSPDQDRQVALAGAAAAEGAAAQEEQSWSIELTASQPPLPSPSSSPAPEPAPEPAS